MEYQDTTIADGLDYADDGKKIVVNKEDIPWVLFTVDNVVYGIHSSYILSIEILGAVTEIANSAPYTRGMTNFRGGMINLTELRLLFGNRSRADESRDFLMPKIDAHTTWIETLRQCVSENTPFTLATDPHKCAFGQWFYSYQTSDNKVMGIMKNVESSHNKLHGMGADIMKLMDSGNQQEAEALLNDIVWPLYEKTIALLHELLDAIVESYKEMLIVLDFDGERKGIIVDDIVAVEYISEMISVHDHFGAMSEIKRIGKRQKDDSPILLIEEEFIGKL